MIKPGRKEAQYYVASSGQAPFLEWLEGLKDARGRATIKARIRRIEEGNPGHCKAVGSGVYEMKIFFGPGYRVYFGEDGDTLIILLCGGDKSSQRKDIAKAHHYWEDYGRRK